ncbi:MAG: hypothetical protein EXS50_00955 [Candidatus Taylorbacteria bacterium]|nr:hypothetical protein [Candidatus Taylorbacteria bacterium]
MKSLLAEWQASVDAIEPTTAKIPPQRMRDSKDTPLGTLSNDMQKFYLFVEDLRVRIEELMAQLSDMKLCHHLEHEQLGDRTPKDSCAKFTKDCLKLLTDFQDPTFAHKINYSVFREMLAKQYKVSDDKPVLGIREGLVVICRAHDDRGDGNNALEEWWNVVMTAVKLCSLAEQILRLEGATPTDPPAEAIVGC